MFSSLPPIIPLCCHPNCIHHLPFKYVPLHRFHRSLISPSKERHLCPQLCHRHLRRHLLLLLPKFPRSKVSTLLVMWSCCSNWVEGSLFNNGSHGVTSLIYAMYIIWRPASITSTGVHLSISPLLHGPSLKSTEPCAGVRCTTGSFVGWKVLCFRWRAHLQPG